MIREMTLGQYYKADSILHKLDPRVKLLGTLLFVITLFFPKSLLSLGIATAFLILIVKTCSNRSSVLQYCRNCYIYGCILCAEWIFTFLFH